MLGGFQRKILERFHKNENWVKPYKQMTPPSIKNLNTLGSWVFFLICCLTFSFLHNVRLALKYLTIPLSSESLSSTLIHSPSSGNKRLLTCTLIRDKLAWNLSIRKTFDIGSPKLQIWLWYHLLGESEKKTLERSYKNENWAKSYKQITLPST